MSHAPLHAETAIPPNGSQSPPQPEPVFDESTPPLEQVYRYLDWVKTLPENAAVNFGGGTTRDDVDVRKLADLIAAVPVAFERSRTIKRAANILGGGTVAALKLDVDKAVKERLRRERQQYADILNASVFVRVNGALYRYCAAWKMWVAWTGKVWERDEGEQHLMDALREVLFALQQELRAAVKAKDKDEVEWLTDRIEYLSTKHGSQAMLHFAARDLHVEPADFDRDPWCINVLNGYLDLKTWRLHPHDPKYFCTRITGCEYVPGAESALWQTFLKENFTSEQTRDFLQQFAGYCLSGDMAEQLFVLNHGPGGSGKSTFQSALAAAMGDYAVAAPFSLFCAKRYETDGPDELLARLDGARLVTAVEGRKKAKLDEAKFKWFTSGVDPIVVHRKYERAYQFYAKFKLMIASNFKPEADEEDMAFWRRLRRCLFPVGRESEAQRDRKYLALVTAPEHRAAIFFGSAWASASTGRKAASS